jgi:ubiquinone/menaquinone biosynthesis C-methylase UbiE
MLRELGHFMWHAPGALRLKSKLPQHELYETLMKRMDDAGFGEQRAALVGDLSGDVLELGSGTGNMFPHYGTDARVTAIEPDDAFSGLSHAKATRNITVVKGAGESVPYPDASFDAVVLSLVLCSVESMASVLSEVRRVLRPGGRIRLIEHVRSPKAVAGWLMNRTDGVWFRLNGQGCHMNRNPMPAIVDAGFEIEQITDFQVFSAGIPAFPMRRIAARLAP